MTYELFYLIGTSQEAEIPEIKKEVESTVTAVGGVFQEKETTEKRRLSYKIKHENHGTYICRRFDLEEAEKISEITKNLNLNAKLLRFLISKTDDLPELKSKEERIEEAAKRDKSNKDQREAKPEAKKSAPAKKEESAPTEAAEEKKTAKEEKEEIKEEAKEEETEEKKEEAKQTDEDIDKKLEEILNI